MPIVNKESFQFEEEDISNQGIEECTNKDKVKDSVDEQNKNVVEETDEIIGNQISEKNYPFDLNEVPEDED
uniref:Uncharacterized protein n=1 Tax=Meloidogyne enterolobii TaxID=390850 RepID=A0A6V7UTN1_MELEN|nr:unnamed protein product [Meloidogyne enterolobii]